MTARIDKQGNSNSKKNTRAKDGSHISNSKWNKINCVYADSEDGRGKGKVYWNAFSPQRVEGTSQSSQSQSSIGDSLSQTSPSVVIGAIHNKRPVLSKRQKRTQTFIRHGSKEELLKSYANASINKKPCKKKKTNDPSLVEEPEQTISVNVPLDESSSPDFPDDGMDEDFFEASQAFEKEYNPTPKIRETPKRSALRSSTRNKLLLVDTPLVGNSARVKTPERTGGTETLSEQFLRFSTSEDSGIGSKKGPSMEGFEDDDDDELFSQVPLP